MQWYYPCCEYSNFAKVRVRLRTALKEKQPFQLVVTTIRIVLLLYQLIRRFPLIFTLVLAIYRDRQRIRPINRSGILLTSPLCARLTNQYGILLIISPLRAQLASQVAIQPENLHQNPLITSQNLPKVLVRHIQNVRSWV